jgi:hypothetical protein
MTQLERHFLEYIEIRTPITFDRDTILEVAGRLGTQTQLLAAAKNALRGAGFVAEKPSTFVGGPPVVSITDEGIAALRPPAKQGQPAPKPWWKRWW